MKKPNGEVNGYRYVNIPGDLLSDKRVPHSAVIVYGLMADRCRDGIEVEVSHGELATAAYLSRSCVLNGISALEAAGHITAKRSGRLKRYRLLAFEEGV